MSARAAANDVAIVPLNVEVAKHFGIHLRLVLLLVLALVAVLGHDTSSRERQGR